MLQHALSSLADKAKAIHLILHSPEREIGTFIEKTLRAGLTDRIVAEGQFIITRYNADVADYESFEDFTRHHDPYLVTGCKNGLLLAGVQAMYAQATGGGTSTANSAYSTPTYFSNAQSCIGVGDSSTAFANTQTGLQASTNKAYEPMQTSYPSIGSSSTANQITFQSSFNGTTANYAWNEFCVFNSPADTNGSVALGSNAIALNRAVSSQGTKSSGATWVISYQLTIS
jgi:hypothetical protein